MEARAVAKYLRISPSKARLVADLVRGKAVSDALTILRFTAKKGARLVNKTLRSAVANAENSRTMDMDNLHMKTITVDAGPTLKRWRPRAVGNLDALLTRKGNGKEAKLAYCGNLLIENRHGHIVDTELLQCHGTAKRDAALLMVERIEGSHRVTVGADKGYDTRDFGAEMRKMKATPHVAQNEKRTGGSAVDGRTTRHPGNGISQRFLKESKRVLAG